MSIKNTLKKLKTNESNLYVVHYSCQNLNDNNENYSPRITSIAVLHVDTSTMHSFSIHLIAEAKNIKRENIDDSYDELEGEMLRAFYNFVSEHQNIYWLHWNMTNINYGFEALSHRYKVLTSNDAPRIGDNKRYNLSAMILNLYGKNSVEHPRMKVLMELNDGEHRDILSGESEAIAFQDKEYVKLHKSTMSKAYWFQHMYFLLQKKKINVSNKNNIEKVSTFLEKPFFKILAFVSVLFAIYQIGDLIYEKANNVTQEQNIK